MLGLSRGSMSLFWNKMLIFFLATDSGKLNLAINTQSNFVYCVTKTHNQRGQQDSHLRALQLPPCICRRVFVNSTCHPW
jgi:hypothetical protein